MMKTVWSKDALPLVPPRFRPIYQVMLPFMDLILLVFAGTAVLVGSKVVADFTLGWFPFAWAGLMGLGAILASWGLVFLHDWTELIGKGCLVIGFFIYGVTLAFYVHGGSLSSLLTIELVAIAILLLAIRIGDLVGIIGQKQADEAALRKKVGTAGRHHV